VVLSQLCLAPLVGWGTLRILDFRLGILDYSSKTPNLKSKIALAVVLIALIGELPIKAQAVAPLAIPPGFGQIARAGGAAGGALLELPLVAGQVRAEAARMRYQTAHGWPIIGGYLARAPVDPLPECAPVWGLITWEPGIAARDVITPHVMSAPLALMQRLDIRYYAVYNAYDPTLGNPVRPDELAHYRALAAATSDPAPVAQDRTVTIYRVQTAPAPDPGPALQVGGGWGALEQGNGGLPFRWIQGGNAALCVQNGAGRTARLTLRATSFAQPRTLILGLDGAPALTATIPPGAFTDLQTPPLPLAGPTVRLTLHVPEGGTSPASLGQGRDPRSLSVGFSLIRLELTGGP
jgi:hypothetical protein